MGLNGCLIVIPERYDCKQLKWLFYGHFNVLQLAFLTVARKAGDHVLSQSKKKTDLSCPVRTLSETAYLAGGEIHFYCVQVCRLLQLSTPGSSVGGLPGGTLPVEMPFDATVVVGQDRFLRLVGLDHRSSAVGPDLG